MSANKVIDFERIYENLSIKDWDEPYSVVNLVPGELAKKIESIPEEFFEYNEYELEGVGKITTLEKKLRTSFWLEYGRAVRTDTKMQIRNIIGGICSISQWNKVTSNNVKLTYIITPRPDYNMELEDMLVEATTQIRRILEMPDTVDGKVDHKLLALKIKIFGDLSDRRRGLPSRKMEIESKNLHLTASAPAIPNSLSEIEARMQQLATEDKPLAIETAYEEAQAFGEGSSQDTPSSVD